GSGGGERTGGVVSQQRRHFERHPAVHAGRPVPDRSKQVGGSGQVLQRKLEKQFLARLAFLDLPPNGGVVGRAVLDGVVEDRRVRRKPRHGELVDVALERAGLQQIAGDVIEPETLASVVERLGGFHRVTSGNRSSGKS